MEDNSFLPDCGDDDVLQFRSEMLRVGKVRKAVQNAFDDEVAQTLSDSLKSQGVNIAPESQIINDEIHIFHWLWFREGIDCELLKIGAKGWQKGKVRIRLTLEFCPDDSEVAGTVASNDPEIAPSESPLDDIRRMMNENS